MERINSELGEPLGETPGQSKKTIICNLPTGIVVSYGRLNSDNQGPDFDDMSSLFPCEIDDAIQYINLGYVMICFVILCGF